MPYYFTYVADKEKYPEEVEWCDKIVMRHPDECTWNDLTKTYEQFLRACGFVFGDYSSLTMVTEDGAGRAQEILQSLNQSLLKQNKELKDRIEELEGNFYNYDDV